MGVELKHALLAQSGRPLLADLQVRGRSCYVDACQMGDTARSACHGRQLGSANFIYETSHPEPTPQEKHGRLAAALALGELTQERDIQGVVAKWGREGFVSKGERVASQGCECLIQRVALVDFSNA